MAEPKTNQQGYTVEGTVDVEKVRHESTNDDPAGQGSWSYEQENWCDCDDD